MQQNCLPTQIPINNHFYPSTNKITTTKSLYDFISECEGVQHFQVSYKGNIIPKTDCVRIPELGYEFGENIDFIEHSDLIVSINLIVKYNNKEKKIYIENQHISNLSTEIDNMILISHLLHTSPNNIINYSEKNSETNPNEKEVTITLKNGVSVYDVEYINATKQIWKNTKDHFALEDKSTILDLKLCITAEFNYNINEIAFYPDNQSNYNEKTPLNSTNDDILCFIYTPHPNQSSQKAKAHNIYMNNQPFIHINFFEEYSFYQIAYLIEKKTNINKNNLLFCGKTINSDAKYKTVNEINPSNPNDPSRYNLMFNETTDDNNIQVRIRNQGQTSFYDLSLPIYSTVSFLRRKIIEKENCHPYFGLVYRRRYIENNLYLFVYYIDKEHPIEITKIIPNPNKICHIFYFHEQRQIADKKMKKNKGTEPEFTQKNFLIPINMLCQDVKKNYFRIHPQSMMFSINGKVFSDTDKMMSLRNGKFIVCAKIPIECFYSLSNKPFSSFMMNPDSRVRSLLKKISTKRFYNVQLNGKALPFFEQLTATSPNQHYIISKVDKIKIYDIENKVEYSTDNIKKCFKKRVARTIKQIHKQINYKYDIKLFSDFIELDMKENPFLCCPTINANTFFINSNETKKVINLINPFKVSIQLKSEQVKYQKPIDFIIGFFGVPENKLTLRYEQFSVPLDFSIWSLPNNAVIQVDYFKNEDEYSQKFNYEDQFAIIPYQSDTTLLDMKKIIQKKFDIADCSFNCISFKFGEKEIINFKDDNNAYIKKLLSDCFVYPLAFITVCTPSFKNCQHYYQVRITTNNKNTSTYFFTKDDIIKDVRILLEEQEGVPIEAIIDSSNQKQLSDENSIPDNLIVKFRHYEVFYQGQKFSFEYSLDIRKAESYLVEKLNLNKSDAVDYRIAFRRSFDNRVILAKNQDLKHYNQFILLRYFKIISIIFEKRLIRINTNLNETLSIRAFKRYVRNNINKPSYKIILSLTETEITLISDDLSLGDIVRSDSPIYVFLNDSPYLPKNNQSSFQQQQQQFQQQQLQQQQFLHNIPNDNNIIQESDIGFDISDNLRAKKYKFKFEDECLAQFEFPLGTRISEVREKIADYLNEKNKDDVEFEDVDSSSIEIRHSDKVLKKKVVIDSVSLDECDTFCVIVHRLDESIFLTSRALRFTQEDLDRAAEEDDDDEEDEDD